MIEARQLGKRYGKAVALRGFDLQVERGELCGLVGPNGAGKSTLIKVLATVAAPSRGQALVGGHDVARAPQAVRAMTGYMPDIPGLYQELRVRELLLFFAEAFRLPGPRKRSAVERALHWAGLEDRAEALVEGLSLGQRQRLFLAKTLLHDPQLLLLDEPATGLDPMARIELRRQLKVLHEQGVTILVSSHILADLEDICTRIVFIAEGKNVGEAAAQPAAERSVYLVGIADGRERARELLAGDPDVEVRGEAAGQLTVLVTGGAAAAPALLRRLVESGVAVSSFTPQTDGLESRYRAMFGGGAHE